MGKKENFSFKFFGDFIRHLSSPPSPITESHQRRRNDEPTPSSTCNSRAVQQKLLPQLTTITARRSHNSLTRLLCNTIKVSDELSGNLKHYYWIDDDLGVSLPFVVTSKDAKLPSSSIQHFIFHFLQSYDMDLFSYSSILPCTPSDAMASKG